jgi:hypothetical protein
MQRNRWKVAEIRLPGPPGPIPILKSMDSIFGRGRKPGRRLTARISFGKPMKTMLVTRTLQSVNGTAAVR